MRTQRDFSGTIALALAAKAKTGSPFTSSAIDLSGYEGCTLLLEAGALGTQANLYSLTATDGDTSAAADTPAFDLVGNATHSYHITGSEDTSSTVAVSSYIGGRRYIKCVLTVTGAGSGSGVVGVTVLKGHPKYPVA